MKIIPTRPHGSTGNVLFLSVSRIKVIFLYANFCIRIFNQ